MWADDRSALAPLELADRERIVDVGCGTGELSAVLAEESSARVLGVDRDPALLAEAPPRVETAVGDATALPVRPGAVDLVVCQALLVNLPEPGAALAEFLRASSDLVAAIEPDNGAAVVESTVAEESRLAATVRERFVAGARTDLTLGAVPGLFEEAGLSAVETRRYEFTRTVEPPYSPAELAAARRKATGSRLDADRTELLAGGFSQAEYERFRAEWRAMGRTVAEQMADGEYRRTETIPFHVTVGRL
jgi:SAM-dependent methyltransferase